MFELLRNELHSYIAQQVVLRVHVENSTGRILISEYEILHEHNVLISIWTIQHTDANPKISFSVCLIYEFW